MSLNLPGWFCTACGVFNGEMAAKRTECRSCGRENIVGKTSETVESCASDACRGEICRGYCPCDACRKRIFAAVRQGIARTLGGPDVAELSEALMKKIRKELRKGWVGGDGT